MSKAELNPPARQRRDEARYGRVVGALVGSEVLFHHRERGEGGIDAVIDADRRTELHVGDAVVALGRDLVPKQRVGSMVVHNFIGDNTAGPK